MKLLSIILLSFISFSAKPSPDKSKKSNINPIDSSILSPLSNLLVLYYDLKNALVNSDATAASVWAGKLFNAITRFDTKSLSATELNVFASVQSKLSYDTRHIAEVQKIEHQREHFASLSINMYSLAKSVRLSAWPVYEDYCPMKKAYWLSEEKEIKNPYYGSQMPDCGDITNTLN
jgi:hypothetical protein